MSPGRPSSPFSMVRCTLERVHAWRAGTDGGLPGASPRSDGTMGELCSQTARPYKSQRLPPSAAKNRPSFELCFCPSSQDVVFPGGASLLLVLCVLKRFPWQPGPPAPQNGEGCSCHHHKHGQTGVPSPPTFHRAPAPHPLFSALPAPSSGRPAHPAPHTPLAKNPRGPDFAGPWPVTECELEGGGPCAGPVPPGWNSGLTRPQLQQSLPLAERLAASRTPGTSCILTPNPSICSFPA